MNYKYRTLEEQRHIQNYYKFFKVADLRELESFHQNEEISYSKMVQIINELAFDFYMKKLKEGATRGVIKERLKNIIKECEEPSFESPNKYDVNTNKLYNLIVGFIHSIDE